MNDDVLRKYDVAEALLDAGAMIVSKSMEAATRDEELFDVLTWLRRHERDMLLGIEPPPLQALIAMLEAGEHRR